MRRAIQNSGVMEEKKRSLTPNSYDLLSTGLQRKENILESQKKSNKSVLHVLLKFKHLGSVLFVSDKKKRKKKERSKTKIQITISLFYILK